MFNGRHSKVLKTRFPPARASAVDERLLELSVEIPRDFRCFLLKLNGGVFNGPRLNISGDSSPVDSLDYLAGISTGSEYHEIGRGALNPYLLDENDPIQLLPIGYTVMGNMIFMVVEPGGDDFGAIGLKVMFSNRSFFIASGIVEFVNGLL